MEKSNWKAYHNMLCKKEIKIELIKPNIHSACYFVNNIYVLDVFIMQSVIGIDCGHKFCIDCWKPHLMPKICDGNAIKAVCCPEPDCTFIVDDVSSTALQEICILICYQIQSQLTDPKIREKYQFLLTNNFVEVCCLL